MATLASGWNIFDFEQNMTKLDRKQVLNIPYQVFVFRDKLSIKMSALDSGWLIYFEPLGPLNIIWRNLTGSKDSTSYIMFVFRRLTNSKIKMAALASAWPWYFLHLLCNCWAELHETWQEASTRLPLPNLFFWFIGKQKWPPCHLVSWNIFDILVSYATTERGLTKDREQVHDILYHLCCSGGIINIGGTWYHVQGIRHFRPLVDGFIFVSTNFRGLNKNDTFVRFKIRGRSIFFHNSYRKLPFR